MMAASNELNNDTKKTNALYAVNTDGSSKVMIENIDERHDPLVQEFPEGGFRAWAAVAGACLCLFVGGVVSGPHFCLPLSVPHNNDQIGV
jgi:hypothetical protein